MTGSASRKWSVPAASVVRPTPAKTAYLDTRELTRDEVKVLVGARAQVPSFVCNPAYPPGRDGVRPRRETVTNGASNWDDPSTVRTSSACSRREPCPPRGRKVTRA
jgi:hypothetical protein